MMTETQVILRVDRDVLHEFDHLISTRGFKTRNEWFRAKVREFVEDCKKEEMMQKLAKLNSESITEDEIVEMVKDWRTKKGKK